MLSSNRRFVVLPLLPRTYSSKALLGALYADSRSSAVISSNHLAVDMGGGKLYGFGNVSTEQGPKSLKVGGVQPGSAVHLKQGQSSEYF